MASSEVVTERKLAEDYRVAMALIDTMSDEIDQLLTRLAAEIHNGSRLQKRVNELVRLEMLRSEEVK